MYRAGLPLLDRKRLELARAMATGPMILLDEIAGGLTEGECHALVATIRQIHAAGTTIIWIEHVLHALNSVVERLMVLNFGALMIGAPDESWRRRKCARSIWGSRPDAFARNRGADRQLRRFPGAVRRRYRPWRLAKAWRSSAPMAPASRR